MCFIFSTFYFALVAKSLQSYPTLCDPRDGSPPGSPIPGILQARTLEWVAISFSNAWKGKVKVKSLSRDSSRPHGLQPTRLLRPWDFPGKSTGLGCHCLLHFALEYSQITLFDSFRGQQRDPAIRILVSILSQTPLLSRLPPWAEFPALYNRSKLVTHLKCRSVCIYCWWEMKIDGYFCFFFFNQIDSWFLV